MRTIYMTSLSLLFLLSCNCNRTNEPDSLSRQLLLVYIVTDRNGLDLESIEKLRELKEINDFSSDYRLLVYADTKFKDTGKLIEIKADGANKLLKEFGETNSADREEFGRILSYVVTNFKAESYGLLLFSHASGWLPKGTSGTSFRSNTKSQPSMKSVLVDAGDELSLIDFSEALPIKFDYIIFEACNMAGVEIAYQLRNKTKRIIATPAQMISPGFSNIYSDLIKSLFFPIPNFKQFVDAYYKHYVQTNDTVISLSLINTDKMDELASYVRSLNSIVGDIDVFDIQQFDGSVEEPLFFFDFLDYYNKVLSPEQYIKLETMVSKIVEHEKHCSHYYVLPEKALFPIKHYSGMSIYIEQEDGELNKEYYKLDWYKDTRYSNSY